MAKSIISNERVCHFCGTTLDLHKHHVFHGQGRRKTSEREGCWCYLCAAHHNMSPNSVHLDKMLDFGLMRECQRRWMEVNDATAEDFIRVFGASYL